MSQPVKTNLPRPSAEAQAHSAQLAHHIHSHITQAGGWLSFADFMQMALYTPQLGYYSNRTKKFGIGGDFVTAPELTPLYGTSVAKQIAQVLAQTGGDILELGAGSGRLAMDVLQALQDCTQLPKHYYVLEVSAHLRQVQQAKLQTHLSAALYARIEWLEHLPTQFSGVVLANEVLDAIPVHLLVKQKNTWFERGLSIGVEAEANLQWQDRPLNNDHLLQNIPAELIHHWPDQYVTEVCPASSALISSLASVLQQGAILLIDYGFSAREYYHPQRIQGTLMCHYQHYSHDDPLLHLGLQDITAHVNFTAIATTALAQGLDCTGYTNQAQFLINMGITELLQAIEPSDKYLQVVSAVQTLLSPAEMGELFKVMALSRGIEFPLLGFRQRDKRHTL